MWKKSQRTNLIIFLVMSLIGCNSPSAVDEVQQLNEAEELLESEDTQVSGETSEEMAEEPIETWDPILCNVVFDSDRDGNREIYIMGPDGENPVNLSNNPADDWDPVFSPDGSRIAFVSNRENEEGGGQFIYVMNADGSNVQQLSFEENCDYPDWSYDGNMIVYTSNEDLYIIDVNDSGTTYRVTDNPQKEISPKWSPDGTKIAWLSGDDGNMNVFVAGPQGQDTIQITDTGGIGEMIWTTDGRIFVDGWGWSDQEEFCHNCVVNTNGEDVEDAGGKGERQRFVPFWNGNGDRVDLVEASMDDGPSEIYQVGEVFEDVFFNMSDNPAWDRNPDWPVNCGPEYVPADRDSSKEEIQNDENQDEEPVAKDPQDIIIGYAGELTERKFADLEQACQELGIQCVPGDSLTDLTGKGVDAIISFSNIWNVLGNSMEIYDATGEGFPVYILDGETDAPGAYNLAYGADWIRTSLDWMFDLMGSSGEMVYANIGQNDFYEYVIQNELAENPDIQAISIAVSYEDMSAISQENIAAMMIENPGLGAIWSSEGQGSIFWGVHDLPEGQNPAIICQVRLDDLQFWKDRVEEHPEFQCIAVVQPGGNAYEAVYVAYYRLIGLEVDPDALGGEYGNTFIYDDLVITNEDLDDWLGRIGELRERDWGDLEMPPMTPDEIKDKWFLE